MELNEQIYSYFSLKKESDDDFFINLPSLQEVKEIGKGLQNVNYELLFEGNLKYILRLNTWQGEDVYGEVVSIRDEFEILKALELYRIAPKVFYCDTTRKALPFDFLIEEYLYNDGEKTIEDLENSVKVVKKIHSLPLNDKARQLFKRSPDASHKVNRYKRWQEIILNESSDSLAMLLETNKEIYFKYVNEHASLMEGDTPLHCDLFPENFLHYNNSWFLIDWQTSGLGNKYWDIAFLLWNFSYQFSLGRELTNEEEKKIISAYFEDEGDQKAALQEIKKILPILYIDLFQFLLYKSVIFKREKFPLWLGDFLQKRLEVARELILKEKTVLYWFSQMKR